MEFAASGNVKRKKFKPPMKTVEQKIRRCTEVYGNIQASPTEQCPWTREAEERCAAAEFPAEEQLPNHGHTLLSYCDTAGPEYSQTSATTTAESDNDNSPDGEEEEDNGDDGPPRRHFKTAKSEPCKYNFSIIPHSKRIRAVRKNIPSSHTTASNATVFDFPDSQIHSKQKVCQTMQEDKTRKNDEKQVARDREVLQIIVSTEEEILRIHERYAILKSALLLESSCTSNGAQQPEE